MCSVDGFHGSEVQTAAGRYSGAMCPERDDFSDASFVFPLQARPVPVPPVEPQAHRARQVLPRQSIEIRQVFYDEMFAPQAQPVVPTWTIQEEDVGRFPCRYQDVPPLEVLVPEAVFVEAPYVVGQRAQDLEQPCSVAEQVGSYAD